jgi:Family of unknown function (DUF5994)
MHGSARYSASSPPSGHVRVPLRLQLNQAMGNGTQDGTWWPQSRDLPCELLDLVDNFPPQYGRVHRVACSRPDWNTAPHRVRARRGELTVTTDPYDGHQVSLSMSTHHTIVLIVTPPERSSLAPRSGPHA